MGVSIHTPSPSPSTFPHFPCLWGPGSAPRNRAEPGLALAALTPPALAAFGSVDLVTQVRPGLPRVRRETVTGSQPQPFSLAVGQRGCCCPWAACTACLVGRALRSSPAWPGTWSRLTVSSYAIDWSLGSTRGTLGRPPGGISLPQSLPRCLRSRCPRPPGARVSAWR